MKAYAELLESLACLQSRNRKLAVLSRYFRATPDPDRGWALASLTDGMTWRVPLRRMLTTLIAEFMDPALYRMSRDYVGDTAETVALLWPASPVPAAPVSLACVVAVMQSGSLPERTLRLKALLSDLTANQRWALLKFIGGTPRVGVSARLARTAVAEAFEQRIEDIEEIWHALQPPYLDLFAWLDGRAARPAIGDNAVFRPVMLAHPIEDDDRRRMQPGDFAAEWKWDGIRVQLSSNGRIVRIFSRQGDDISPAFPELITAYHGQAAVLDGELLVMRSGIVAPFNDLQQRLNRKSVTRRMLSEHPVHVRLYDMLFDGRDDIRTLALVERRARLEAWFEAHRPPLTDLSERVPFDDFRALETLWSGARDDGIEGLMLKRKAGPYIAGRVKGEWYKWKRAPMSLDCVLMYAQRGSGKRSSFYSDYTFGVWRAGVSDRELVPVGKAYSGFTDEELRQLDRWIRTNTVQSFGPVRAVEPNLVLEVVFDAVQRSSRHKSGVAMRFPRIHRIRWDKPAAEADELSDIEALLPATSPQFAQRLS